MIKQNLTKQAMASHDRGKDLKISHNHISNSLIFVDIVDYSAIFLVSINLSECIESADTLPERVLKMNAK